MTRAAFNRLHRLDWQKTGRSGVTNEKYPRLIFEL
jgi:hypothetical protein